MVKENNMTQAQRFADEAIFVLQLNTRDAVKYIQRNADCDEVTAMTAFKSAAIPAIQR
jgi:hypothetical protein